MLTESRFVGGFKRTASDNKTVCPLELKVVNPLTNVVTKGVDECLKGSEVSMLTVTEIIGG